MMKVEFEENRNFKKVIRLDYYSAVLGNFLYSTIVKLYIYLFILTFIFVIQTTSFFVMFQLESELMEKFELLMNKKKGDLEYQQLFEEM